MIRAENGHVCIYINVCVYVYVWIQLKSVHAEQWVSQLSLSTNVAETILRNYTLLYRKSDFCSPTIPA